MDHQEEFEALERVLADPSADPIQLSHKFLEHITEGFSHVIGSGGFGVVCTGFVNKNVKVAVKTLSLTDDFSDVQFGDELRCLQSVKHKNIVRCLGYCSDTQHVTAEYKGRFVMAEKRRRYLCFEFAPNLSLHEFLKGESSRHEWETRYQLIVGICLGLQYLHNKERINHLDLKPANILLDADKVPKITDFGLSRRFSGAQYKKITQRIRGSLGYMAPEYWFRGEISFRADIFSLGVIMKNIIKGSLDLSDFDNVNSSISMSADGMQSLPVYTGTSSKQQQLEQINGVLKGPGEQSTEGNDFVPNLFHDAQSMSGLGPSTLVQQNEQITTIPKGFRETSTTEVANSSISMSVDGMQSLPISAGTSSKRQQQEQINGVLRGPGEQSTEGNNFDPNLFHDGQSMSGLGPPTLVQQNKQITTIPKGSKETSSTEVESSCSVPKLMDNNMHYKVVSTEPLSSHHHLHQQQQIISVLKGPAEEVTEGNNFVPNLLDESQPMSNLGPSSLVQQEQITNIPKEHRETSSNNEGNSFVHYLLDEVQSISASGPGETSTETSKLLDVHPKKLRFPLERNKLIRCPLTLTNRTEHYVGIRITLTYPDKRSGLCFPVMYGKECLEDTSCFEILGPHSTLAVPMTMKELRVPPPCDTTGKLEVLMILMSQKKHLEKLLKASNMDDDFLKRAQELEGTVHRVIVEAAIQDQTSWQPVITNYKFMPTRTSSFRAIEVITDIHPTKTWLLARQKGGGYVSIWDYQTQKMLKFVKVTKVNSRERHPSSRESRLQPNVAPIEEEEEEDRLVRGERSRAPPPRPRLSLPEDLYPQQEIEPAVGGSDEQIDRGGVAPKLLDRGGGVDVAARRYWRHGEPRRPRHGRYDDEAATRTHFISRGRRSWGGAPRWGAPAATTRRASSSRRRPTTTTSTHDLQCLSDVRSARFIAREPWLAVGDDDGCVHVYDYSRGGAPVKVTEFTAHDGGLVDLLSVHPTRQLLLTAYSFEGTVKLWNWGRHGWECTGKFDVRDTRLLRLSWNPSDTNVFATLSKCNTLKLWRTDSSDPSTTIEGMNKAEYLCSGTQRHLMVTTSHLETNDKKSAMIKDLQTKNDVHRLGLSGCDIYDIACHPTLPILATSHSDGSIVCLWNTLNYRLETILQLPESHSPGLIFITSTEDVTRLVAQCPGGISTVEIRTPTSTWTGNGGEN